MSREKGPKASIVVPVFNERATIEEILRRIQAVDLDKEIIIVDDGSTDGTKEILATLAPAPLRTRWGLSVRSCAPAMFASSFKSETRERAQRSAVAFRRRGERS